MENNYVHEIDFEEHNAHAKEVWDCYKKGNPIKVPVKLDVTVRSVIMDPKLNLKKVTWKDYLENPDVMWETQIMTQEWIRFHILTDDLMGYPEHGWPVFVDFQNVYEEAWFGADIYYGTEPDTRLMLDGDRKNVLFERGIPDVFDGIGARALEIYEYFQEKVRNYTYKGIPAAKIPPPPFMVGGTDGPLTIACGLRGSADFLGDMLEDPDYAWELLDFITTAIITRIKKGRRYFGIPEYTNGFAFADDAIAMISPSLYREMILPFHKRLVEELSVPGAGNWIHLCGDAQRFFPILEKELNIREFDTGFPIDFGRLYDELSPEVRVNGGPNIALLQSGTPEKIEAEVKRILESGVMEKSKRFVLRDANLMAPCTPLSNINAIYEACEKYGYYI